MGWWGDDNPEGKISPHKQSLITLKPGETARGSEGPYSDFLVHLGTPWDTLPHPPSEDRIQETALEVIE